MICRKVVICGILLIILLSSVGVPASSQGESSWWDKNWSFRQEIQLPISTEDSFVKYQPIDIRIKFNDVCWAKNEHEHSVRVVFQDVSNIEEIESQIYDLDYSDNNHITSCSLVFLVPETANGKEKYYVYYDDKEKPSPDYPSHVAVSKEHYYYEPIPGQKADIDYYKIIDESFCVYGVGIQGMMMIDPACQMIFRQEQNQKDLSFKYWDKLTSFCFQYRDNNRPVGEDVISTRQSLISSEILADGNLMVAFKIVSTSSKNDVKTTIEYKYYYCPLEIKRICLNVKHEFLKNIEINKGEMMDGSYVFMSGFKTRSEANTFLNAGEILPYIHFYDTDGSIKEIEVDTTPTSREEDWMISL
ncbi:carboxypeptidase regulatory-like domain-containing protein, partial [candidate division WOR-3 bacterium]|nr:carboxypeptidase regulatory-like domain-containing protein [candidate division WOR-3 bacterium]